jgi:hypothetical protein
MARAREQLMGKGERAAAMSLARSVIGSRAAGRPIDNAPEMAVRLARLTASLCRHIEAAEMAAKV